MENVHRVMFYQFLMFTLEGEERMSISSSSMPRTRKLYKTQKKIEQMEIRSRSLVPGENAEEQAHELKLVTQEKNRLQDRLTLSFLLGILLVVSIVLAIAKAFPQQSGILWLFEVPELPQTVGDFATILTPLLAISVAIERLLETAFNWYEQTSIAVADILVAPRETLDWVQKEYQESYETTQAAAETLRLETTPETLHVFEIAENRLAKAEERLRGWVQAPEYLAWKKALCIWIGLLTGLIVSILGDLGILHYVGVPTPRIIDMLVTGLVIGSGPGPMHDLIGILQSGRNALNNLGQIAKTQDVQDAIAALRQSEAIHRTEEA
ncbi:hypothetical protein U27_06243 [Candidatus Vecturithrix granuli]|uniref:Uncharacterized protein n=1 Tax=Vecturithrix granuli TaxID=1499967 RepID=A0A081C3W1_VECG1|nr:hypothetical protein U27_06243 [Candidatus Vecturithrix granuli]